MTLDDLQIASVEVSTVDVDISAWFGEGVMLTLKEADAPAVFASGKQAQLLRADYPEWPDTLAQAVAMLGNCHIKPETGKTNPVNFYAQMAANKSAAFFHVLNSFNDAFGAVGEAKNG